jgi:ATP-dependent DNA ligase
MVKQATLASFFGNALGSSGVTGGRKAINPSKDSTDKQEEQNKILSPSMAKVIDVSTPVHDDSLHDTDDDDGQNDGRRGITSNSKKEKTNATKSRRDVEDQPDKVEVSSRRKRQKILDDSSDEEMNAEDPKEEEIVTAATNKRKLDIDKETNDDEDYHDQEEESETNDESEDDGYMEKEDKKKETQRKSKTSKVSSGVKRLAKSNSGDTTKDDQAPSKKKHIVLKSSGSNGNGKNNAASSAAALLSSTESILSDNSCLKHSPIPYSVLCKTLSDIESISSRLEIQKHLTNLFRLCLLKNPKDLISLIYLASNTVAAAYECVELGIGDSILIKAIGEASGSNPSIIKQKYEADGDLGTVAMTAKGKQRTLGFGIKPKPLAANEVLSVFRQIAMTTGAQSQKWKINKIKGLLVRVQDPIESKYIIRGLQGKLRIGLAQSTVLISLAHAVLLSNTVEEPREVDMEKHKQHPLSLDCKNVRNKKLALEARLESAVNIVKKAYSEVSSFDAVVDALLQHPLSLLNEKCTLKPGIPVEPMLAKPTKSVQEVLKRLNGKRFTCEFKYDGERAQVHMDGNGVTKVSFICNIS